MSQKYTQFENALKEPEPEPNWKAAVYSIPIMKSVDPEPPEFCKENELVCSWKLKLWALIFGIAQMVVCTIGLATVFWFGQDKVSESLMLLFESYDRRYFFDWIATILIVFFSNGIFWGLLLFVGAIIISGLLQGNFCLLAIWMIAVCLIFIASMPCS